MSTTGIVRRASPGRHGRAGVVVGACLTGAYLLALTVVLSASAASAVRIDDVAGPFMAVFSLAATLLALHRARRAPRRAARPAWLWIAGACFVQFASCLAFAAAEVRLGPGAFPAPGDYLRLLFVPVMLVGMMRLAGRARTAEASYKSVLDIAMAVTGGGMLLWQLVVGPVVTQRGESTVAVLVAAAYPVSDLALLAGALILAKRAGGPARVPSLLLASAMLLLIIGDVYLSYQRSHTPQDDYQGWQFICWITAFYLLAMAAAPRGGGPASAADHPVLSRVLVYLPYAGVGLGYVLLLTVAVRQPLYPFGGLAIGAVVATMLVTLRQVLTLRENARLVLTDNLTGLANRAMLTDRLARALRRHERQGRPVTVLLIDLNEFKAVNDTLGHQAGDALLVAVGRCLARSVSPADTAARLGGDEFAVVLESDGSVAGAAATLGRIEAALREPVILDGVVVTPSASIGAAHAGPDCTTGEQLLRCADEAMYRAKVARRHRSAARPVAEVPRLGPGELTGTRPVR